MNTGFDPAEIKKYKTLIEETGTTFLMVGTEENNDEFKHFMFIGKYEGKEVVYDAIAYTLRLEHETGILELTEQDAIKRYPQYEEFILSEGDESWQAIPQELQEEIGMMMAETIVLLEEEGAVTVSEHIDLDTRNEHGIGFEAGLRVEKITDEVIKKLIVQFNNDSLVLDETLVSFQRSEEED